MMNVADMTRSDLECAILEYNILPANSDADINALAAMSVEQIRAAVAAWVEAGDECGKVEVR